MALGDVYQSVALQLHLATWRAEVPPTGTVGLAGPLK